MRTVTAGAIRTEVCVLGGGPAGAALACRLAGLGHEVCLLDRAATPGRRIGETLPAPALPILDSLGLAACAEAAAYRRSDRARVLWSGRDDPAATVTKPGLSIDRRRFDRALIEAARAAGAEVLAPSHPGTPVRAAGPGWRLPVETAGERLRIEARFLVDARGRRARIEGRSRTTSARTLALSASARRLPASGPESCIEACADAWCWGMTLPDGRYTITAFVDADVCRGSGAGIKSIYQLSLQGSVLLRHCLGLDGPITVCDASSSVHECPIGPDFVRTGEAAFAADPLSSQGVQLAITSALQAAAALHTMLATPAETGAALVFYRERQQEAAARSVRTAARLYAAQDRHPSSAFWQRRALTDADPPAAPSDSLRPPSLSDRVRLSAAARVAETPVLAGDLICRQPALSHPSLERPLAWLGDAAIAPLLAPIVGEVEVAELLRCWVRSLAPRRARETLHWLAARGIVVPAEPRARSERGAASRAGVVREAMARPGG